MIDQDDSHVYQAGLFVPFGLTQPEGIVRARRRQLHSGISYKQSAIDKVDIHENLVRVSDGTTLSYDVLVVATGAVLIPDETDGLTGPGWMERIFTYL